MEAGANPERRPADEGVVHTAMAYNNEHEGNKNGTADDNIANNIADNISDKDENPDEDEAIAKENDASDEATYEADDGTVSQASMRRRRAATRAQSTGHNTGATRTLRSQKAQASAEPIANRPQEDVGTSQSAQAILDTAQDPSTANDAKHGDASTKPDAGASSNTAMPPMPPPSTNSTVFNGSNNNKRKRPAVKNNKGPAAKSNKLHDANNSAVSNNVAIAPAVATAPVGPGFNQTTQLPAGPSGPPGPPGPPANGYPGVNNMNPAPNTMSMIGGGQAGRGPARGFQSGSVQPGDGHQGPYSIQPNMANNARADGAAPINQGDQDAMQPPRQTWWRQPDPLYRPYPSTTPLRSSREHLIHEGRRYVRRDSGTLVGMFVTSGEVLTIDGEEYIYYRALARTYF